MARGVNGRSASARGHRRADRLTYFLAGGVERDVECSKRLARDPLTLCQQAEQDVFGPDETVVELPGLVLGVDQDSPGAVREPFEHTSTLPP